MCVRLIRTCNDDVCASCMMYVHVMYNNVHIHVYIYVHTTYIHTCICMYVNKYSAFYEGSLRTHNEPLGPGSS